MNVIASWNFLKIYVVNAATVPVAKNKEVMIYKKLRIKEAKKWGVKEFFTMFFLFVCGIF